MSLTKERGSDDLESPSVHRPHPTSHIPPPSLADGEPTVLYYYCDKATQSTDTCTASSTATRIRLDSGTLVLEKESLVRYGCFYKIHIEFRLDCLKPE